MLLALIVFTTCNLSQNMKSLLCPRIFSLVNQNKKFVDFFLFLLLLLLLLLSSLTNDWG